MSLKTWSCLIATDGQQPSTSCLLSARKAEATFQGTKAALTTYAVMSQPSKVGVLIHRPTHPLSAPCCCAPARLAAFLLPSGASTVSEVVLAPLCGH